MSKLRLITERPPNVIAFPSRPSIADLKRTAMGRSRKLALPVLMARVRELYNAADPVTRRVLVGGREFEVPSRDTQFGNLAVSFARMGDGYRESIYFSISSGGTRVMTGHLYDDHDYHVMSWKRGDWQAQLFG
jgi:hypothetical protein